MKKIKNLKFKRKYVILLILISIYIVTRVFFLFSINLFSLEECTFGTITKEIIEGPKLPLFDYPRLLSPHYPSRLFSGFLAVPFYLIFGESGISLKLMFIMISAGTLCLVYLFLDKFFSRKSAIIASILMIFSIPVYTLSTLSQSGPHLENLFFDILIIFLFYNILFDKKQDIKSFIFFGLASGFAVFINYRSLVMIFTCILFWFIFDKKFLLRKYFFIFITSFFIGLIPWIYYNITHNFVGLFYRGAEEFFPLKIFGSGLSFGRIASIITKFKALIVYDLPKSFMFKDVVFINSDFFSYSYLFLFIISFISLFYLCRKHISKLILSIVPTKKIKINPFEIKKEIFILVYILIFFVVYSISSFEVDTDSFGANGYRYLLTIYVFIFIIISLFIAKLWNKKTKFIFVFLIIILILLGLMGNLSFVSFRDIGKGVVYRPYCYDALGHLNEGKQCDELSENYRSLCYGGHALFVKYRLVNQNMAKAMEEYNKIDKEYKCSWYRGIGHFVHWYNYNNLTYVNSVCDKIDEKYKGCFYKGVGWVYGEGEAPKYPNIEQSCNKLNLKYKKYCFEGFGQAIGQFIGVIPTQAIRQCNKIEPEYRPYCFKGLAWSLAEKFGDNPARAGKIGESVDEEYRDYFYRGIGSYIGLMFGHNITRANEECNKLGDNNIYCIKGLREYINEMIYS